MLLLHHCALCKLHMTDGQNRRDQITRDRRSRPLWSNCVLYIPFILSGISNECWLPTCDVCVMTTWRLGLRATRGWHNKCSVISERVVAIFWPFGHWLSKSFPFIVTPIKHSGGSQGMSLGGPGTPYLKTRLRPEGKNFFPLCYHYSGYLLTHVLELNLFLFKGHCAGCHCTTVEDWKRMKC